MTGYEVEKRRLRAHADTLDELARVWKENFRYKLEGQEVAIPNENFTVAGEEVGTAYNECIFQVRSGLEQIEGAFAKGAESLEYAARTYGLAEEKVREGIKHIGEAKRAPEEIRKIFPNVFK
ncbi:hypothetical protein [Actinomadura montaniterrae]|uniref:PE domain-containing protein n=1 Tax=Actinomadura montaniterrae TaxID=1803903 RepID=A0A6L3VLY4_9ACTN|nr:hypothetical protein [Actinomadura montaniterrae]KAB2373326.1 hypothetical protein F9B16_28785 [Actinomadura montaniterrae]